MSSHGGGRHRLALRREARLFVNKNNDRDLQARAIIIVIVIVIVIVMKWGARPAGDLTVIVRQ